MKIVQINSSSYGSTGKIMFNIHKYLLSNDIDSYVVWGRGKKSENDKEIALNNPLGVYIHVLYTRLTGKTGFASKYSTYKLVRKLKKLKPDIIHLHNLHGYYINLKILFKYINKYNIKVVWTLHDCWSFTGQCPHFTLVNCNKWKNGCYHCPMIHEYPKTIKDNSSWNYKKKKKLFSNLNITLVTPSKWLESLVKQSYLKDYPTYVINNGIDLNLFKKMDSNFKSKYGIENKKIILGVASIWDKRKGLNEFFNLAKILDDNYVIVIVGLLENKTLKFPSNIIYIPRTENQKELVSIYNAADILLNSTYEDNYPTVNLEALACETPVLSFDSGGSVEFVEFIKNKKNEYVISKEMVKKDIYILKDYIDKIVNSKLELYNKNLLSDELMSKKYKDLYIKLIK